MIKQVKTFMEQWNMVPPGSRVLAGVSGGADSVCLCLLLKELSTQMDFTVEVVHVEHGIRGEESRQDAAFVEKLCKTHEILCRVVHVDVPAYAKEAHLGEEEAARVLRYRVFAEVAKETPGVRIALAHHLEDNAETMLFQLIRGSGIDGLCGMQPVRSGEEGEVYIRPFLQIGRGQIEDWLMRCGQEFRTDSTNYDETYSRNRMRSRVLPQLAGINPQAVAHMNQTMAQLQEIRDYMEGETARLAQTVIRRKEKQVCLDVPQLLMLPQALVMRLIRRAVQEAAGAAKDITAAHLQSVRGLLEKQTGKRVDLPYGLVAVRVYDDIMISAERACAQSVCVPLDGAQLPQKLRVADWEFTFRLFPADGNTNKFPRKIYTKWFDYDKIKDSLAIRNRRKGDFFLLDAAGHHKKLEDYFVNEKIPAAERDACLLLASDTQVFWIVGGRMAYGAGISADTKQILEITAGKCH